MSREPTMADLVPLATTFSRWICNPDNVRFVREAIANALSVYKEQRTQRKHIIGAPRLDGENMMPAVPSASLNVEERDAGELPAFQLPVMFHSIAAAAQQTASTALNKARFFVAAVAEEAMSNRAEEFESSFGVVDDSNAAMAFFYIGNAEGGWEIEAHNVVGRTSLKTRVLANAFDAFVTEYLRHLSLNLKEEKEDCGFEKVEWKSPIDQNLAACLDCYNDKTLDLRCKKNQAKEMFCRLTTTQEGTLALTQLKLFLEARKKSLPTKT